MNAAAGMNEHLQALRRELLRVRVRRYGLAAFGAVAAWSAWQTWQLWVAVMGH